MEWLDARCAEDLDYDVDAARLERVVKAIQSYWPQVPVEHLHSSYCGIRPKLSGKGEPNADFLVQTADVHGVPGLINLFGIESPGLTSCLALGQHVRDLVEL